MNSESSLTPVDVADLLKITKNTVYELIKRGELPSYKIGRKIRIDKEDVENYINNQKSTINPIENSSLTKHSNNVNFPSNIADEFIICGHDTILDILSRHLERHPKGHRVLRSYLGSYNALYELYNNRISIASTHLWDHRSNEYNIPFVRNMLPGIPCVIINLCYRYHGFYVQRGNPKNINTWEDLNRPDIKLINREKGSGTRILLDEKLNSLKINSSLVNGYNNEEFSSLSVASFVAQGAADVALGHEKIANQVNLIDFIPLQKERYDLVIKQEDLSNPTCQAVIDILNSNAFKYELEGIGGYDLSDIGKIISYT